MSANILSAVYAEVWAMQRHRFQAMLGFLEMRSRGILPEADVLDPIKAAAAVTLARSQAASGAGGGAVAVLPLFGLIMPRGNMVGDISGPRGTSVEGFTESFRAAIADPNIGSVVIDIDSPGGCVSGVPELAAEILNARKTSGKKIVGISDGLCASAGYWIGAACSELVVTPSSLTGSIGVYTAHEDNSEAYKKAGTTVTLVSYGEHKVAGNDLGPLDDAARADMQERVNFYGAMFDKAVSQGRKMKVADVQGKLGQGKLYNAPKAVSSGMADRVGTLDDVLAGLGVSRQPQGRTSSSARGPMLPGASASAFADASDGDDCTCPCDSCMGDDGCLDCETADCDYSGCMCEASKGRKAKAQAAHAHRKRSLELAALG